MTVGPPDLQSSVEQADVIVEGQVVDTTSAWVEDQRGRHIYTTVTLQVSKVLKGNTKPEIKIEVIGGTAGEITERVSNTPIFSKGMQAVLLLKQAPLRLLPGPKALYEVRDGGVRIDGRTVKVSEFMRTAGQLSPLPGAVAPTLSHSPVGSIESPKASIERFITVHPTGAQVTPGPGPSKQTMTPRQVVLTDSGMQAVVTPRTDKSQETVAAPFEAVLPSEMRASIARNPITAQSTPGASGPIFCENFEGDFPGSNWAVNGVPSWDDTTYSAHGGSRSAWCGKTTLDPANGYVNNMSAWMVYGPFSLSDATNAWVDFWFKNKSEQDYDYFGWYASTNGTNFYGSAVTGDQNSWRSEVFDLKNVYTLGNLCGQSQVWIAFIFQSDFSNTDAGAFVDDICINADTSADLEALDCYAADPSDLFTPLTHVMMGQPVEICFKFSYQGPVPSATHSNVIQLDGNTPAGWTGTVSSTGELVLHYPWTATAGDHRIQGWCDYANVIAEADESNNYVDENPSFSVSPYGSTIFCENFEGDFPGSNWDVLGTPSWDDTNYTAHGGSRSAWCGKTTLDPANGYVDDMNALMIYGPFSLSDATNAWVDFWFKNRSEQGYDYFGWYASTNGTEFFGTSVTGDQDSWRPQNFDLTDVYGLGNLCGQSQVWIAFAFQSDSSVTDAGAFVDDICIRKDTGQLQPTDLAALDSYAADPSDVFTPLTRVLQGQDVNICLTFSYQGPVPSQTLTIRTQFDDDAPIEWTGTLPATGEWVLAYPWTATAGCHRVQVWYDSNNEIVEVDESNNYLDDLVCVEDCLSNTPHIDSILEKDDLESPDRASAGTGSKVTIAGTGFGSAPGKVWFFYQDGQPKIEAPIISWSDTEIVCIVPIAIIDGYPASASSGPVTVETSCALSNRYDFKITFGYDGTKWCSQPVGYRINENTSDCTGEGPAVQAAADTWNSACANFSFRYDGSCSSTTASGNGVNEILWQPSFGAGILAGTYIWSVGECITECDVVFNDDYTWSTDGAGSTFDIQTIGVHEMGHWLCLRDLYGDLGDNEYDAAKIMFGFGSPDSTKRNLHTDDADGIRWIYGTLCAPTNPSANPTTIGLGGSSTLSATPGCGGDTIVWFSGSCDGTYVGTGVSLPVSPISTTTYYAKTMNSPTDCLSPSCADPVTVTVNTDPDNIGSIRGATASGLDLRGIVTAKFAGCIYVESADRSSGARVVTTGAGVAVGDRVWFTGDTEVAGGQKQIINPTPFVVLSSGNALPELGMRCRDVGGHAYGPNDPGITNARGPLNVGLYVTIQGTVTYCDTTGVSPAFYVWDGTNMVKPPEDTKPLYDDNPGGHIGLRVANNGALGSPYNRALIQYKDFVTIKGIVSLETMTVGGVDQVIPVILPVSITPETAFDNLASAAGGALNYTADYGGINLMAIPGVPGRVGTGALPDPIYGINPYPWDPTVVFAGAGQDITNSGEATMFRWENANSSQYRYDIWESDLFGGMNPSDGYWVYLLLAPWALNISGKFCEIPQWYAVENAGIVWVGQPHPTPTQLEDIQMTDGGPIMYSFRDASQIAGGLQKNWVLSTGFWWNNQDGSKYDVGLWDDWPTGDVTYMSPWHGYLFTMQEGRKAWIIPYTAAGPPPPPPPY